jgi:uncharacterized membrane protein YgcG
MMRLLAAILAWCLLCGAPGAATGAYLPQERIPTDSPVYRDLERLATRYGVSAAFLYTRPLKRVATLGYLEELARVAPGSDADPAYRRAMRFLDPAAPGAVRPLIAVEDEERQRLEISPYASLLYSEDTRWNPEINRDYRVGVIFAAQLDTSSVVVADFYEGNASQGGRGTPDFGDFNSLVEGVNFNSWVNEAYVDFPVSKIRFLFGRTWLRWGPGQTGTLALSHDAPALDLLGAGARFGKLRYEQFVSLLDPGPQTYLAGHRLEWQAGGGLSVGLTEMARFDGTSQALLYMIPFVPYSFWEKRPKTGGVSPDDSTGEQLRKNNVLWAGDVSWVAAPGWRLFGEFLLDDYSFSSDYKPDMFGYQAGVDWRRALAGGGSGSGGGSESGGGSGGGSSGGSALGALVEYSRVHNFTYSVYHNHDFAYDGFPVGYVLGPDVQRLMGELSLEYGANWELALRGEWLRKGEGEVGDPWLKEEGEVDASEFQGVVEKDVRVSGSVTYSPIRSVRLQAMAGYGTVENWRHVPASDEEGVPFTLRARLEW